MLKILHLSDIHLGSGYSHGRFNPQTGVNTRFSDFVKSLNTCIERAIAEPVDLVLFGGDAFPDAKPAPYMQEAFAKQFYRLADANIPAVLLVGNHDLHTLGNSAASLCIYQTLAVPGFIVGNTLTTHRITTANGDIQVITLPWLTNSALLTRPETQGLSSGETYEILLQKLDLVLEAEIRQLNPNVPTVLLGHLMVDKAVMGQESYLAVGKGFNIPLSLLTRSEFDYVALGHVHKHQNLNKSNDPPVVYPGSIERVDFSEEKEPKGYVLIEIEKGKVNWEFCPLAVRKFLTIEIDVSQQDDPVPAILDTISSHKIQDAVVRVIYKIHSEQLDLIKTHILQKALENAHSFSLDARLISQLARPRLPELAETNSLNPLDVLKIYLDNREELKDISTEMLEAAQQLLAENLI